MFGRNKVEQPFNDDWKHSFDKTKSQIRITGSYISPQAERRAGWLAGLLFIVLCVGLLLPTGNAAAMGIGFIVLLLFCGFALHPLLVKLHNQRFNLLIGTDTIKFPAVWSGKTYARAAPIEFRVEPHHKGIQEEQRELRSGQRGSRLYRDAIEVVMQYGEKRVVLAEMRSKDLEKAKALVIRIQNWHESFDSETAKAWANGTHGAEREFEPEPDVR
jgi:hypothetical protein